jgi:hypothetical protein
VEKPLNKFVWHAAGLLAAGCAIIAGMLFMLHRLERQLDDLHLRPMQPKVTTAIWLERHP